tara:strand:- start:48 stop:668 length:621 start_codon:yes stop_codon:yes gene_type:complete
MIEIIVEEEMSTAGDSGVKDVFPPFPAQQKKKKKKEQFSVTPETWDKFKKGKMKFERWSRYLDLKDESQKKIYDWAKRHHNGALVLQNAVTGALKGVRYNQHGGGRWGSIQRVKEQILRMNANWASEEILNEDVLDILRKIVKNKQHQKVKFQDKKTATVDGWTASAMVKVYDKINKDNQDKFRKMINLNQKGFMTMQSFALKQVK